MAGEVAAGSRTERVRRASEGETRKQQIARRLKLSERVLEQYYQSKQAELEDEVELDIVPAAGERRGVHEKRI